MLNPNLTSAESQEILGNFDKKNHLTHNDIIKALKSCKMRRDLMEQRLDLIKAALFSSIVNQIRFYSRNSNEMKPIAAYFTANDIGKDNRCTKEVHREFKRLKSIAEYANVILKYGVVVMRHEEGAIRAYTNHELNGKIINLRSDNEYTMFNLGNFKIIHALANFVNEYAERNVCGLGFSIEQFKQDFISLAHKGAFTKALKAIGFNDCGIRSICLGVAGSMAMLILQELKIFLNGDGHKPRGGQYTVNVKVVLAGENERIDGYCIKSVVVQDDAFIPPWPGMNKDLNSIIKAEGLVLTNKKVDIGNGKRVKLTQRKFYQTSKLLMIHQSSLWIKIYKRYHFDSDSLTIPIEIVAKCFIEVLYDLGYLIKRGDLIVAPKPKNKPEANQNNTKPQPKNELSLPNYKTKDSFIENNKEVEKITNEGCGFGECKCTSMYACWSKPPNLPLEGVKRWYEDRKAIGKQRAMWQGNLDYIENITIYLDNHLESRKVNSG